MSKRGRSSEDFFKGSVTKYISIVLYAVKNLYHIRRKMRSSNVQKSSMKNITMRV